MRTRVWLPLTLCATALAPVLAAQEAQEVTLQFKHQPGQTRKFRFDMKADLTVTPEGAGGGIGALPIGLKSTSYFTEKVQAVDGDSASLLVTPLSMVMDTSLLGMSTVLKMEGGKVTMNGQPLPPGGGFGGLEGMVSGKAMTVRRNALGQVTVDAAGAAGISQMLNSSFLLQLPEKPVKIGDSWETSFKASGQLPVGGPLSPNLPDLELKLTHTLKSLEMQKGSQVAVIETKGSAGVGQPAAGGPEMPPAGQDMPPAGQTYSGTTHFDVTRGTILSGKYGADVKMKVPVPAGLGGGFPGAPQGAPMPEGAPGSMQIDGMMTFTLGEAPLVTPKPAPKKAAPVKKATPAKKPAPRKPAPKK